MSAFTSYVNPSSTTALTLQLDEVSENLMYIGQAAPGSPTSAASWSIRKISSTGGNLSVEWASAGRFNQVWDNRASLSYS